MNEPASGGVALGPHRVRTRNLSINSANKIHDDEVAAEYGFAGGLVAGTLVYAHMTTPLVERLGAQWLDGSVTELRLHKPAYDGESLTVRGEASADGASTHGVRIENAAGEVLATLETRLVTRPEPVNPLAGHSPADPATPVVAPGPDTLVEGRALRALAWHVAREEHEGWVEAAGDSLPVYRGACARAHPGRVLQAANDVFNQHFRLDPWIHVGSRVIHLGPVRVDEHMEVRAVPTRLWSRGGHEFVTLYVVMLVQGVPRIEVEHTAIWRAARRVG
jgi:hypothetical protein